MVKQSIALLCVAFSFQLNAQPQIKFKEVKQSFGFVKNGAQVKLFYQFTNTGNQPLFVRDGVAACSCTEVNWPKQPILPNKTDSVEILFDTTPAHGRQDRTVDIYTNTEESPQKIRFKGVVLK